MEGWMYGSIDSWTDIRQISFIFSICIVHIPPKYQILTEHINMYGGGCTISNVIGCGTPVSTSLSSVSVCDDKRLSIWICYIAGSANLCPGDCRLRSTISNAAKLDVISFSKVISR